MRSKIIKKVNEIDGMENDSSGSSLNDTYESTKPDDETVSLLQAYLKYLITLFYLNNLNLVK